MINIRVAKKEDAKQIARVISKTFSKFNYKEGSKKSIKKYIENYSPNQEISILIKKFNKTPIIFVAIEDKKIIGVLRGNKNRIVNLYILGKYHGKGIGKKLLEKFEKKVEKMGSKEIKIKSSLYGVKFYEKMGYKKSTGMKKLKKGLLKGIKFYPMIKKLGRKN